MTLSPWIIYFWGTADQLRFSCGILFWISIVYLAVRTCMLWAAAEGEVVDGNPERKKRWAKHVLCAGFVSSFLFFIAAFMPSSKTIAVMVVAPAIINSEPIQKDLPELYKAAKDALMSTLTK